MAIVHVASGIRHWAAPRLKCHELITDDYLKKLLAAYISGMISDKEREALFLSLNDEDQSDRWKTLIKELSEDWPVSEQYNEEHWEPVIREILRQPAAARRIPLMHRTWFRAAASVLLLLGMGVGWYIIDGERKPDAQPSAMAPLTERVLPAGNKAILRLADGSSIVLDSLANGIISDQGNARVVKLEDGQLAYTAGQAGDAHALVYNTIVTPRGGQYRVVLPDGTAVWLNCASSIRFPTVFDDKERRVAITGEAYFEVTHLSAKRAREHTPFIVEASGTQITVIGTHFNVNAYEDEDAVRTTLVEGSVKINSRAGETMMKPGEQVLLVSGREQYDRMRPHLEEVLAWKDGKFLFRNTGAPSILRQISRWYDVNIHCPDDLSDIMFSGSISRKSNMEDLIELLELDGRIQFTINGRELTVMPK